MALAPQTALLFEFHDETQFGRDGLEQCSRQARLFLPAAGEQDAAKLCVNLQRNPERPPHLDQRTDHWLVGRVINVLLDCPQAPQQFGRQWRLWR